MLFCLILGNKGCISKRKKILDQSEQDSEMEDMVIVPHFFTCSLHCSDFGPLFENELIQLGNLGHGVNYSDFLLFFMIWLHYL